MVLIPIKSISFIDTYIIKKSTMNNAIKHTVQIAVVIANTFILWENNSALTEFDTDFIYIKPVVL